MSAQHPLPDQVQPGYTPVSTIELAIDSLLNHFVPVILLTFPPFRSRLILATLSTLYIATALTSKISRHEGGDPGFILFISSNWCVVVHVLGYTIPGMISDKHVPEKMYWRKDKGEKQGQAMEYGFGLKKFYWSSSLLLAPRKWGWNHQVKGISNSRAAVEGLGEYSNKAKFVLLRLERAVFWSMMVEAAAIFIEVKALNGVWYGIMGAITSYGTIQSGYSLGSALTVLLGLFEPSDWPNLFGSVTEIYTIQTTWSNAWHQMYRWGFLTFSGFVKTLLGVKPGTYTSRLITLYTSFALSAWIHYMAVVPVNLQPLKHGSTSWDRGKGIVYFFMSQAVAITVQDSILGIYQWMFPLQTIDKKTIGDGSKEDKGKVVEKTMQEYWYGWKIVGSVVTMLWFCWSAEWVLRAYQEAGLQAIAQPKSVTRDFLKWWGYKV